MKITFNHLNGTHDDLFWADDIDADETHCHPTTHEQNSKYPYNFVEKPTYPVIEISVGRSTPKMMESRIHGCGSQGAVTSSKFAGLAASIEGKYGHVLPLYGFERRGAPVYEVVEGRFKLNMKPRNLKPLKKFFKLQGRFRHMTDEQNAEYESSVHDRWQKLLVRHERGY